MRQLESLRGLGSLGKKFRHNRQIGEGNFILKTPIGFIDAAFCFTSICTCVNHVTKIEGIHFIYFVLLLLINKLLSQYMHLTEPGITPYLIFGSRNMILKQNLNDLYKLPDSIYENEDENLHISGTAPHP